MSSPSGESLKPSDDASHGWNQKQNTTEKQKQVELRKREPQTNINKQRFKINPQNQCKYVSWLGWVLEDGKMGMGSGRAMNKLFELLF